MLVFALLVFGTMRFIWPHILNAMEERSRKIAQGLAAAEQAEQELAEARGHERLEPWSEALRAAAEVVRDPRVRRLLGNPRVTPEQLAQLVSGIAGTQLGEQGANFVRMLAGNRRLGSLPEISALFDDLKDAALGVADVTVTSAAPVDASQQHKLAAA